MQLMNLHYSLTVSIKPVYDFRFKFSPGGSTDRVASWRTQQASGVAQPRVMHAHWAGTISDITSLTVKPQYRRSSGGGGTTVEIIANDNAMRSIIEMLLSSVRVSSETPLGTMRQVLAKAAGSGDSAPPFRQFVTGGARTT